MRGARILQILQVCAFVNSRIGILADSGGTELAALADSPISEAADLRIRAFCGLAESDTFAHLQVRTAQDWDILQFCTFAN